MINKDKIASLLEKPESSILDYKEIFYDFTNDKDFKNTAKFIKDVICFSNTIRTEKGFILFGIQEKTDKSLEVIGLNKSYDDSILQEKVKDKVYPRPIFAYYELDHNGKKIGILEFPIKKYELPITPVVKMKGLEVGKVYYRNGTSNTEANGIDVIRINEWFKSLPGSLTKTLNDNISEILKRLTLKQEKLSVILTDLINISKEYKLTNLEKLCNAQISGIKRSEHKKHMYRIQKVYVSLNTIEINPYSFYNVTIDMIKSEIGKNEDFFEFRLLFTYPIVKLEEMISNFNDDKKFGTIKMKSKELIGKGNYNLNVYIFGDSISGVYSNIRQRIIDELVKI